MNKQRRKEIKALTPDIAKLDELAGDIRVALNAFAEASAEIIEEIERIKDAEQEYIDNLPENLQQSERAQDAEQAVSDLGEAMDLLDVSNIDWDTFDADDLLGKLDEAAGPQED